MEINNLICFTISEWYVVCLITGLTLYIPGSPNSVVEANLVSPQQLEAFEILPFWWHQPSTYANKTNILNFFKEENTGAPMVKILGLSDHDILGVIVTQTAAFNY